MTRICVSYEGKGNVSATKYNVLLSSVVVIVSRSEGSQSVRVICDCSMSVSANTSLIS
uniref:Uncharacterized protein n=1 Tax=Lepeophtheirus salmonis TaxID=72036 RepID=A0A0K2V1G8_LEPSM